MFPERLPVRDGEQRDSNFATVLVHFTFDINGNGRRALIQYRKLWIVIEESGHGNSLSEKETR